MGVPDPPKSVPHIRGTFGRMVRSVLEQLACVGWRTACMMSFCKHKSMCTGLH